MLWKPDEQVALCFMRTHKYDEPNGRFSQLRERALKHSFHKGAISKNDGSINKLQK
jgi:hypothetical protein